MQHTQSRCTEKFGAATAGDSHVVITHREYGEKPVIALYERGVADMCLATAAGGNITETW